MEAMPEFVMGQRVRVREDGGDLRVQPDKALLGKSEPSRQFLCATGALRLLPTLWSSVPEMGT